MAKGKKQGVMSKAGQSIQSSGSGALNDQFSNQQNEDVVDSTSSALMNETMQKYEDLKAAPENIKNTYNNIKAMPSKVKKTYNAIKNLPSTIKRKAENAAKAAKKTAENTIKTAKAIGNAIAHPIETLKRLPANIAKAVRNLNPKNLLKNLNPRNWLKKLNPITRIKNRIQRAIDKARRTVERVKKTVKMIEKMIKFAIKALKAAAKATKALVQLAIKLINLLIQFIIATWPIWLVVLVLGIIIGGIWYFLDNDSTMDNKSLNNEKSEYNESVIDSDGNAEMTTISGNTKVIEAFYQYFAEKSLWVVYDGVVYNDDKIEHDDELGDVYTPLQRNTESFNEKFMDETGEVILKDYQDRESMFYINPNALFVYDKYLHGEQFRFPEQIVQHVAYDYYPSSLQGQDVNETNDEKCLTEYDSTGGYNPNYNKFILKHLTDDETRILNITSQKYKAVGFDSSEVTDAFKNEESNKSVTQVFVPDGDEKIEGVWDYGLGSILHYVKYLIKHENRGIYENFEVWDKTMKIDPATGLKYYGETKEFPTYEDYEADGNHANYDATDIAELQGDDRLKTYTADNAPTEAMKQFLADEDSYFIDWVVTAAGDISNSVTYEWKDSGQTFTQPEPFDKTVERFQESLEYETEEKTITLACGESKQVAMRQDFIMPLRTSVDDEPQYGPEIMGSVANFCDGIDCSGQHVISYTFRKQVIKENYEDVDVTFNADVNGTTWNKQPFYDGSPYAENISGRRYYEDYMTHYNTYVPHNVTGFFNLEDMLRRIQLNVTDPDLEEELTKILERSEMKNDGANSLAQSGTGFTLGSGANEFEMLYNGSARETIDRIWDGLVSWGYNEAQAAAMLGNIFQESRYKVDVVNSIGASGLCQWLGGRRTQLDTFAGSVNNTHWTDLNTQIQFMCMELDVNKYTWASYQWSGNEDKHNTFLNSSDPAEIAVAVMSGWERSGQSETGSGAMQRAEVAQTAYSLLSGKEIEYPIDTINPSTTGSFDSNTEHSSGGNIFTSIWNWLKSVGDKIKAGVKELFGFEDEYYDIMTEKERYHFIYHSVQEEDVDYVLQSIFAYTDDKVISNYYLELTDQFFIDRFTDLFSNPIGTSWSSATAKNSDKTALTNYISIRQENYPDGFQTPLDECVLSGTDSQYGLYVEATDGQNCYAVCNGTITKVGDDDRYGGKYLILDNGICETVYGHLKDINVTQGQDVNSGDILATVDGDEMFFGITNEYKAVIDASFILHRLISDGTLGGEIAAYAVQCEGGPYLSPGWWSGEMPYTATDCSGFVCALYRHFGLWGSGRTTAASLSTMGIAITQDELMPGDIICYKKPGGSVHHVAMYIGEGEIVHAKGRKYGVVIDSMNYSADIKICRRFVGQ